MGLTSFLSQPESAITERSERDSQTAGSVRVTSGPRPDFSGAYRPNVGYLLIGQGSFGVCSVRSEDGTHRSRKLYYLIPSRQAVPVLEPVHVTRAHYLGSTLHLSTLAHSLLSILSSTQQQSLLTFFPSSKPLYHLDCTARGPDQKICLLTIHIKSYRSCSFPSTPPSTENTHKNYPQPRCAS